MLMLFDRLTEFSGIEVSIRRRVEYSASRIRLSSAASSNNSSLSNVLRRLMSHNVTVAFVTYVSFESAYGSFSEVTWREKPIRTGNSVAVVA